MLQPSALRVTDGETRAQSGGPKQFLGALCPQPYERKREAWGVSRKKGKTSGPCRNRDADVENKGMDTEGGKWRGMNWEIGIDIYTLICIKWITNENLLYKK